MGGGGNTSCLNEFIFPLNYLEHISVYPPESDDENRVENLIDCSSSEEEEEEEEEEEDQEYSGPEAGMSSGPSGVQATRPRGQSNVIIKTNSLIFDKYFHMFLFPT